MGRGEGNRAEANQDLPVVESVPADEKNETYPLYIPTPTEWNNHGNEAGSPIPREGYTILSYNMSISTPTKRSKEGKDKGQQESKKARADALEGSGRGHTHKANGLLLEKRSMQ